MKNEFFVTNYIEQDGVIVGVGISNGDVGKCITTTEAERRGIDIPNDLEAIDYRNLDENLFSLPLRRLIAKGK